MVDKDYIYTFQENGGIGYYIEKISMDGQKRENTGIAVNGTVFNITEDQIYYSNAEDNGCLYKANKDGTQKRKVSDLIPRSISVLEYKNYVSAMIISGMTVIIVSQSLFLNGILSVRRRRLPTAKCLQKDQ